ncbi:DUF1934 domain-containing protein [Thalassobacillus pellis]|uniref:DUF1934 domain-containing protein n=1 Tax=Thalassobacillus pellis TaxID=748008 RepID=UPI0019604D9C|nr:DUF1934 domain-containing protein [Thalassobacillus pellis]MBM7551805.1 uncharacterized beta-barrel protein YwiB (DUF1934 family) [Thalassobacillus pellis]
MSSSKVPVAIRLVTEIRDGGRKENVVLEEPGGLFERGSTIVLKFTEHPEESGPIETMVTIQPEKVSIKRSGAVKMHQIFERKRETENKYHHTYGIFHMHTFTDQIEHHSLKQGSKGRLFISYRLTLNHEVTQRHRLTLTYHKEAAE